MLEHSLSLQPQFDVLQSWWPSGGACRCTEFVARCTPARVIPLVRNTVGFCPAATRHPDLFS
jgi:hypothetical protein